MSNKREPKPLPSTPRPAFINEEAYEQYMIGLAYALVEQRLLDGTATSQETTHFLRMGSAKERREAKLEETQIELMEAKKEALQSQKRMESLYQEAINAARSYGSPVTMGGEDAHE